MSRSADASKPDGIVWNSIHYTVQDSGDLFYFHAELREFFRDDGLHPVGKRPFRS